jgi:uncharacterized membrane protein
MLASATISLLIGALLAQRAKVFILIPAISLTLLIAIGTAFAGEYAAWTIAMTASVIIAGLQIGYLLGIAVRFVRVLARASRMRSSSPTSSRPAY